MHYHIVCSCILYLPSSDIKKSLEGINYQVGHKVSLENAQQDTLDALK